MYILGSLEVYSLILTWVGPMVGRTHPYIRGRKYTPKLPIITQSSTIHKPTSQSQRTTSIPTGLTCFFFVEYMMIES